MNRLRRKACVALLLFTLFIFGTMMGLRTLKPTDGFSDLAPGMELMPLIGERMDQRPNQVVESAGQNGGGGSDTKIVFSNSGPDHSIFYDIHIFYYLWYGSPQMDGKSARDCLTSLTLNYFQVAFHLQPYKGRTDLTMHDNIKYIIDK
uniref:Uncharacterized protein n=1 Tax=Sinocyclocheilus grahami TaxID=75366 RepID=A0A672KBX6_SINGR